MKKLFFYLLIIVIFSLCKLGISENRSVYLLTIDGPIGPAVNDYVIHGIEEAEKNQAELIILQMDTPGGLDHSMRAMIKAILNSKVPVAAYVSPEGSRAASAGTYILYASHIAAMAPATNLGAATPVFLGGDFENAPQASSKEKGAPPENSQPNSETSLNKKAKEDAVAYLKSLAQKHGRNAEWTSEAVLQAKSITAEEALQKNVIDFIAPNLEALLAAVHGRTIELHDSEKILQTQGLELITVKPQWRNQLLQILSDPNLAYILLMLGVYGILFELMHPGTFFPGVLGAIAFLLALYSLHLLPLNYTGLGLLILGIALMAVEAFVPSFGALGIGGGVAFVLGSFMLLDTQNYPQFFISKSLIFSMAAITGIFLVGVFSLALKAKQKKIITGAEEMIGTTGELLQWKKEEGLAFIHGETWRVISEDILKSGDKIKVLSRDGLVLKVKRLHNS